MKKFVALGVVSLFALSASATVYNDSTGETFFGGHMDIVSVEVQNDLNDIIFTVTVDAANPGWGNYMIGIDSVAAAGDAANNAWTRPISFSANPIDYWIGSWTDGAGGVELWTWNDGSSSWGASTAPGFSFGGTTLTYTVPLANLGLSVNDTFSFDVFSAGSNSTDGPVDALSNPVQTIADWGGSYDVSIVSSYTVVPEPTSLSLLALGGLAISLIRRRRA